MKSLSLRNITLLSSLVVTILFVILLLIFKSLDLISIGFVEVGILFISIFLISSIVLYVFLSRFVFRRINELKNRVRKLRIISNVTKEFLLETFSSNEEIEDLHTEVEEWAEERKNEIDKLQKLEVYRKEFLGNVSHELKTPIFNIQGYVATLLDGGIDDKTINKDYLMRAEKSVDRMISMIGDLEAITQLETGQLEIDIEEVDIMSLIKDVFETEERKATAKGIILRFKEAYDKPVFVFADKFRIRQVLTNLIVNSIHYGKEYGETMCRIYEVRDNIQIEIIDNGPGIAKEHLPRLFERFYRVDKGRSRSQGGTGLGLSIVKHIIEAHGQTISVDSKEGDGTTFSFTLKKAKE